MSYEEAADLTEQLIADLTDREELGDTYEMLSDELRDEVRERWIKILMEG